MISKAEYLAMQARLGVKAEPRKAIYTGELESDLQGRILEALDGLGRDCWYVWHRTDKRTTCKRGTPDIVGAYRGKPFAIEVKRPGKKVTPEQSGELIMAKNAGAVTGVATSVEEALAIVNKCHKLGVDI